jgi:hypothetical protein
MFTATIDPAPGNPNYILVSAFNANGEYLSGWALEAKKAALAKRLARAIEAGKAVTVNNGLKVVRVTGRTMNADLKRLGF